MSQLSEGTLLVHTKRMRENQDSARHALTNEDTMRKEKLDGRMGDKLANLFHRGPITSDASYDIVKQATRVRVVEEDAKRHRKCVKTKKSKEKAQTNREQTESAIGEIRRGEAQFPGGFSLEVLKAMAANLCPDLKRGAPPSLKVVIR